MPAKPVVINLLGRPSFERTPLGRIVYWATTYGRYIMVGTEVVVLLAFISRFSIDRKLTDLKEEIEQKQLIIESNIDFENEIRSLQSHIKLAKGLIEKQGEPLKNLRLIPQLLPPDVYLETYDSTPEQISLKVVAGTTRGFAQFLTNVQSQTQFKDVTITSILRDPVKGILFDLIIDSGMKSKVPNKPKAESEEENLEK